MSSSYDVVVVGARCAGSPTAMLLARAGHRVLLVDRASFPSDTLSTHVVQPLAAATLGRWGLLERLVATGCPPIDTYAYDFGPFTIAGSPGTAEAPVAYCPRRTVLDKLLVDAAAEAGAEVRERFAVEELLWEGDRVVGVRGHGRDGGERSVRAALVVGADGWRSRVAAAVAPDRYRERPPLLFGYYAYWSGLPMAGRFEIYIRPQRGFAAAPTHAEQTLVIAGWPCDESTASRSDIEAHYLATLALAPAFAARLADARRESNLVGAAIPNYFRKPYGPGWALVGDAGYLKDSITAQGIHDAFRDAELCARAVDEHLRGGRAWEDVGAAYQLARDADSLAMYEFTCQLATLSPPPLEQQEIFAAIAADRAASDEFARANAGTISPGDFFAPASLARFAAAP